MVIEIKGDTRQQHDEEPALLDPVYEKTGTTLGQNKVIYSGGDAGLERISSQIQE